MARRRRDRDRLTDCTPRGDGGLAIERRFTRPGVHPFDEIEWESAMP